MLRNLFTSTAVGMAMAVLSVAAHAAPVVFFGENQNPGNVVGAEPAAARASFLSNLVGVTSEGFENFEFGRTPPLDLAFAGSNGTLVASLLGQGFIENRNAAGRFNASPGGSKWFDAPGNFAISFATPISAFGFYGSDIGDFNGQVTISLTDINDAVTTLTVGNTVNGNNASLLFWGFIDVVNSYKSVAFGNTAQGFDGFGFDEMVIGDQRQLVDNEPNPNPNPIPEPGSLALVGLSLAALSATRRRFSGKR